MNICFCLQPEHSEVFWSIAIVTVSFLCYHFITSSFAFKKSIKKYFGKKKGKIQRIMLQRLTGVFFFGIIPLATVLFLFKKPVSLFGLNNNSWPEIFKWIMILAPVIIIINFFHAKNEDNLVMYPQIRKKRWTVGLVFTSAISWIAYLISYELMFRGFLLFSVYYVFGAIIAISVNTCIYALVHLPKGIKETIGAIPLGIIFSILSLQTGNIWIAFFLHVVMALSNEWFSLRAHPNMKLVK